MDNPPGEPSRTKGRPLKPAPGPPGVARPVHGYHLRPPQHPSLPPGLAAKDRGMRPDEKCLEAGEVRLHKWKPTHPPRSAFCHKLYPTRANTLDVYYCTIYSFAHKPVPSSGPFL